MTIQIVTITIIDVKAQGNSIEISLTHQEETILGAIPEAIISGTIKDQFDLIDILKGLTR